MKNNTQEKTEEKATGKVVIDVRFHPNGRVNMINNRPANMSAQDWFDFLCKKTGSFRPLSGGRGSFAIPNEEFAQICAQRMAAE